MWLYYALFFAVWSSITTLILKSKLSREIEPLPLIFILIIGGLPFTFVLLQFVGGIPSVTTNFYLFVACSAVLDAIAFVASFKAIKLTDISIIAPIGSFGPVFTTILAIFALGEVPTPIKSFGILFVLAGSYLLNISEIRGGVLAPFKKLMKDKGVLYFFIATFLWSITPIFQKKAILETHPQVPLFASFMGAFFVGLILAPFAFGEAIKYIRKLPKLAKWFGLLWVGGAFSQYAAFAAFALTNLAYATPVLRLSGVFTIVLGGTVLKEKNMKERLIGAGVMLAGVLLIVL